MADYYCDHGAYATSLGATPTWGVPQEGDGSSKDAATASSIVSIDLTSFTSNAGTFALFGSAAISVGAAASGATLATQIASAINASTVVTANATVFPGAPQIRNAFYARTSGATLEIMCRIGSTATNILGLVWAGTWTAGPPGSGTFSGGSGGCWGWFINPSAIGVGSSYAVLAYGVAVSASPLVSVSSASVVAKPTLLDDVYVRTGAGYTITCAVNTCPNLGTPNYAHNLIIDSNTVWTGDSGTGVITVSVSTTSVDLGLFLAPGSTGSAGYKSIRCINKNALKFYYASSTNGNFYIRPYSSSGSMTYALLDGILFEEAATGILPASHMAFYSASGWYAGLRMKNCTTKHMTPRAYWNGLIIGGALEGLLILEGCTTITNHTAGSDPGAVIAAAHPGSASGAVIKLIGHSISGWSFGNYRALNALSVQLNLDVVVDGCTGFALGAYVNVPGSGRITNTYTFTSPTLGFRHEYAAGVVDWNPSAAPAYPTRSASMFDGTPWAIKMDWFATTANVTVNLLTPKLSTIVRLASAVRTVSVDFLSPVTLTSKNVALRVHYVGTDGKAYCDTTWAKSGVLTLPVSAWTGAGSYPSHVANRLALTTSQAVAVNTEIFAFLEMVGPPPGGSGIQLYVDPEFAMT